MLTCCVPAPPLPFLYPHPPRCSSEVSRLRSLVTLVDYMVAEAYVSVAISAMQALLNFFEDPSRVRVRTLGSKGYTWGRWRGESVVLGDG